jgi:hypothetical protein
MMQKGERMGWISVKDELPNYRENVIVFTEKHIDVGHLARGRYGSLWWERDSVDVWKDNEVLRDVTHWMPLPEEPEK